jgi:hypothetical protein
VVSIDFVDAVKAPTFYHLLGSFKVLFSWLEEQSDFAVRRDEALLRLETPPYSN